MASSVQASRHVVSSGVSSHRPKTSRRLFGGVIMVCAGVAAASWVMATLATMQTLAGSHSAERTVRFETSLALNPIVRTVPGERRVMPGKFSRLPLPLAERIAQSGLTPEAIRSSRMRMAALARLSHTPADQGQTGALTAEAIRASHIRMTSVAAVTPVKAIVGKNPLIAMAVAGKAGDDAGFAANARAVVQPVLVSALVEPDTKAADGLDKPFSLVMADPAASLADDLPDTIPLPVTRPEVLTKAVVARPAEEEKRPGAQELAYARPDAAIDEDDDDEIMPTTVRRRGGKIAYYDISAGVVHMPNGEKLEAHSGIGKMRDNPKFTHVKMRGPTPAGTYRVTLRESLFHGVEAVRLTPTDGIAPLGRTGLLAHSYLLRTRGDSHGCVAFADYPRFLKAFKRGEVEHMVIVPKMSGWRAFTASADDGKAKGRKVVR